MSERESERERERETNGGREKNDKDTDTENPFSRLWKTDPTADPVMHNRLT